MSTRQGKKRKGRNNVNNRERTVTTFTEDPNTSFLVPLSSEDPPSPFSASSFSMHYQQQFYQPILPPGKNDLEILENLKSIIKQGQHEFYRAVPQPAALASLYMGNQDYPSPRFSHDTSVGPNGLDTANNIIEPTPPLSTGDTSPSKLGAVPSMPDLDDHGPPAADPKSDSVGEYQPVDTPSPNKAPTDDRPQSTVDDNNHENGPLNGTTSDPRLPSADDNRFYDRDRVRDADRLVDRDRDWERDRDRHDPIRGRDRDIRDRRPEFFGRSYGRSHAPRPPPELRHYEPSYGSDYVPPRRYETDDRRPGPRSASFDDRPKPPPFDDRRPPLNDHRSSADDRRLTLDDRPIRPLPETRPSEDRVRPPGEARPTAEDDRPTRATSLATDDRPRVTVPLEERLSQPAPVPAPSLQDRLSQPASARVDIASAPTLEERLSLGPVPPRTYRAASIARDDLRAPLPKDDARDHDRITDFRSNRDFSRERPGGPLTSTSTYRPDLDRGFADRDERDRRDRDVPLDVPPRFADTFSRVGPPPQRRYTPPPPLFDRDRERERARPYYPPRSPPPFRGEGAYYPDGERRFANDRERDTYEQRRREWYGPGDDDKRGPVQPPPQPPPPPTSWRPQERPPFMDRDRERFDRERERERDVRERDRERERDRDLGGLPPPPPPPLPPARGHWDDRDRRFPSPPPSRMDTTVGPGRSLSTRLTDPYPPLPPSGGDERTYVPPPRDLDRGRYGAHGLDDHVRAHPPPFSRVRNRSPSPRRAPDDMRPPLKRVREDNGPGYVGGYSRDYMSGPPPSSATTTSVVTSTVPPRSAGTGTPPVSAPPPSSAASSSFYERGVERDREYNVRGEWYDRDGRGRRSPPRVGYGRGVVGDRRDDRRYVPPPPRTN